MTGDGRVFVVDLDGWGERVAAVLSLWDRDRPAELHVLVASEREDRRAARAALDDEGRLLIARGTPFLTVLRACDGIWVGPATLPGLAGCPDCWRRRREAAHVLLASTGGAGRRCDPADDVTVAARAIVATTRRLLDRPAGEHGVVRRLRPDRAGLHIGRWEAVPGCPRCDVLSTATAPGAVTALAARRAQPRPRQTKPADAIRSPAAC